MIGEKKYGRCKDIRPGKVASVICAGGDLQVDQTFLQTVPAQELYVQVFPVSGTVWIRDGDGVQRVTEP